jgi:hypothetical protein
MYIFAEPYDESEIDAIQTGEYIKAVRLAEERARAEAAEKSKTLGIDAETSASETDTPATTEAETVAETEASSVTSETDAEAESISTEESEDLASNSEDITPSRPLLTMSLKAENFVNGVSVEGPPLPTAEDRWEIAYTFDDYEPNRAIRLHKMSQDRRRKAFDEDFREQALEGKESALKNKEWSAGFLAHLKELSQRGKVWREEFEQKVGNNEKMVWKQGPPPSKYGMMAWKEQQERHQKQQERNEEQRQQHDSRMKS